MTHNLFSSSSMEEAEAAVKDTRKEPAFTLPVDSDHKATELRLWSWAPPHMRAFHLSWVSLFACFFSTFAIPPLLPVIRDDLNLTDTDIGNAGIASFVGSIFSRLAMGPICDLLGPRLASATLSLLTAPIVFATSLASSPQAFILLRFLIGFSLANFVANQFWTTSMFSNSIVGLANGVSAGWSNVGSGATQLLMPLIYSLIINLGVSSFTAWRVAFIIPATFQTLTALMVLAYGQDLPDGNYREIRHRRAINKPKDRFFEILLHGLRNYRGWILGLIYGFCFGVELTMDNIIAQYFYDRFDVEIRVSGAIAASFGLANIVSRPMGGVLSDEMAKKFGIRGRLWSLWVVITVAGLLCILLGRVNSLAVSIIVMCAFSFFVQAASGLTFGVVPFVSRRSLGVISGMTGSGGTMGSVVTQLLLFSGSTFSKETGISLMGVMMIVCSFSVTLIYFPQWGGMFCGPISKHQNAMGQDYYLLD
ncbi:high affinity nitrate transporter 2.5-like [Macadamia integrifolia]|uniref:high affinity nitrate transporter 2.5-like n=1 Tax=Macadamia integrifolia TaxID=60698 RepID=UPI001C500295|nr:high affinity nitrate transporter 2.5-like [Macadamia integrifolia]